MPESNKKKLQKSPSTFKFEHFQDYKMATFKLLEGEKIFYKPAALSTPYAEVEVRSCVLYDVILASGKEYDHSEKKGCGG